MDKNENDEVAFLRKVLGEIINKSIVATTDNDGLIRNDINESAPSMMYAFGSPDIRNRVIRAYEPEDHQDLETLMDIAWQCNKASFRSIFKTITFNGTTKINVDRCPLNRNGITLLSVPDFKVPLEVNRLDPAIIERLLRLDDFTTGGVTKTSMLLALLAYYFNSNRVIVGDVLPVIVPFLIQDLEYCRLKPIFIKGDETLTLGD